MHYPEPYVIPYPLWVKVVLVLSAGIMVWLAVLAMFFFS